MPYQERLSQMGNRSVNGLCPLKQTPNLGTGPLERGHRVVWTGRALTNQTRWR